MTPSGSSLHPAAGHRAGDSGVDSPGGGTAAAARHHEEAEQAAPARGDVALLNPYRPSGRLLLAQGDLAAAIGWIERPGATTVDLCLREPEYLCWARPLSRWAAGRAPVLLSDCTPRPQPKRGSAASSRSALRSLALAADGDETGAVAARSRCADLAHRPGYMRVFADEGHQ
jgi:hypothetical protein